MNETMQQQHSIKNDFREVFLGGGKEKEPVENFFDCRQSKFSTGS
jgi:hypothetical protein